MAHPGGKTGGRRTACAMSHRTGIRLVEKCPLAAVYLYNMFGLPLQHPRSTLTTLPVYPYNNGIRKPCFHWPTIGRTMANRRNRGTASLSCSLPATRFARAAPEAPLRSRPGRTGKEVTLDGEARHDVRENR